MLAVSNISDIPVTLAKIYRMDADTAQTRPPPPGYYTAGIIRTVLIGLLGLMCWRVFAPFSSLVVWALILAIALHPLHQRMAGWMGRSQKGASVALVLFGLLLIGVPLGILATSLASDSHVTHLAIESQSIRIPVPDSKVRDWPVIGEKVFAAWDDAATNMPEFQATYATQLKAISTKILGVAKEAGRAVFLFIGALVIAGIMMAFGESGNVLMRRVFDRVAGPKWGMELHTLSVATVRSVAIGVVGVAFFQALLFGFGFLIAGIPFPGMLSLVVLMAVIVQLPAAIFGLPVIIYLWTGGDASSVMNVFLTILFGIASVSDNILKPIMLGRGVKAPMPVILIGALGGMAAAGLIGLFMGAVVLALGYQIFMIWVNQADTIAAHSRPGL